MELKVKFYVIIFSLHSYEQFKLKLFVVQRTAQFSDIRLFI